MHVLHPDLWPILLFPHYAFAEDRQGACMKETGAPNTRLLASLGGRPLAQSSVVIRWSAKIIDQLPNRGRPVAEHFQRAYAKQPRGSATKGQHTDRGMSAYYVRLLGCSYREELLTGFLDYKVKIVPGG